VAEAQKATAEVARWRRNSDEAQRQANLAIAPTATRDQQSDRELTPPLLSLVLVVDDTAGSTPQLSAQRGWARV
jgi:hypothetical protein